MKHLERRQTLPVIVLLIILAFSGWSCTRPAVPRVRFGLVVHGGAGTILKENMTPAQEEAYRSKLTEALMAGYEVLNDEGPALEAVVAAIVIMEDSPLFNAGKGAVFNSDGKNELDASIMDGDALRAGAVAGVRHVKNPIRLARLVMEASPHVMMASEGAERFAQEQGVELMTDDYFFTQHRWEALQRAKEREKEASRMNPAGKGHGTVGAVALDRAGNLAAGTSTGGMTNKKFGRVGDSPIIGAGTYADNQTCAVSCTGHGEYFIRAAVAHDISALLAYHGLTLQEAAHEVVMEKLAGLGGTGGLVAIDKDGYVAMPFNTEGMYRGYVDENGQVVVKIY